MAHIHTDAGQHDHTASAFIIRTDFVEPKVMVHMHKKLGQYLQFGGHVELSETHWQAVTHELKEESGYELSQLQLLQPRARMTHVSGARLHPLPVAHQTHKFGGLDHYHDDIAYVFVTNQPPKYKPYEGESSDLRLLTRNELIKLSDKQIPDAVRQIFLFALDECLNNWEMVPPQQFSN